MNSISRILLRMSRGARHRAAMAALMLTGAASLSAQAADTDKQNDPAATSDSVLLIGGGIAIGPRFAGSKENRVSPGLMLDYSMANGLFASTSRGIGWGSQTGTFSYSAALAYRDERTDKDTKGTFGNSSGSKELRGMGRVAGSPTALLSMGYTPFAPLSILAAIELPLSKRENGMAWSLGTSLSVYAQGANEVALGVNASGGDHKYMQTYFGVTAAQSQRTGYSPYSPDGGFHSIEASATWTHKLDERWAVASSVGVTHLVGDAAKSPLAKRKTAPTAAVFVTYRY